MATLTETLSTALQRQQEGQSSEAERIYRALIQQQPDYIDARNLLGALLYQQNRCDAALEQFEQVMHLQPSSDSYNSMGVALKGLGRTQEAADYYRKALALQPDRAEIHNNLANALRDFGQFDEAIAAYRQSLILKPNYAEAENNLGAALKDVGQLEEAIAHYRSAILLKPNYPEAHHNLGVALHRQGQVAEGLDYLRQAIALKPNYPEAFNSLGNLLQQTEDFEEATAQYQQALALRPDYAEAYHGLANLRQRQKQLDAAIALFEKALEARPFYPEALNNWGNALQEQGKLAEAMTKYRRALELHPSMPEAHSNLGAALKEQKQYAEAIDHFQQALAIREEYAEVHNNLGNLYQEQGDIEAAIACYQRAVEINPNLAEIHSNLGNMLQQMDRYDEAFAHFHKAIEVQPGFAGVYNNLGITHRNCGQIQEAFAAYEAAIARNPDFVEAHWNKALTQLLVGEIATGFAGYEWRLQWSKFLEQNPLRPFSQPRWDGSPLQGKTIFLYAEQGMGDTIQFIRYVPLLAQQGARVIVEVHPPLLNLLQQVPGIDQLIPAGSPAPADFDVHAHLLSLPALCKTTLETIPAAIPYLASAPGATPQLPAPLHGATRKLGLVWSGNVQNPYNRQRAVPLEQLLMLLEITGIQLYSLQKDLSSVDQAILQAHPQVINLQSQLTDFVDTAALIAQLDGIISVDTAVTHLAGAMGKPVYLLMPFAPDWRWLLDRNDSPWYPTVQLFRQTAIGQWDAAIATLYETLAGHPAPIRAIPPSPATLAPGERPMAPPPRAATPATPAAASPPALPAEIKLAIRQHQAGQVHQAAQTCRQLLERLPNQFEAWHLLGVIAHQDRRFDEAIGHYRKALGANPNHVDTYNNLGVAFHEQGKIDEAIAHYEKVLAVRPNSADAHNNYANALQERSKYAEAENHYRQAIAINPNYADAYNNLGLALHAKQDYAQAAQLYRRAVELKPDYAQAHNHLGNALKELGDFDEAVKHYQKAIELNPKNSKALNNWGNVYRDSGDLTTAIAYYDRATDIDPNFAEAHWNKALTLLLGGDLQRGFEEYEWRWHVKLPSFQAMRTFPQPLWDGTPLNGKTILLHAEQGMGDIIQFIRYTKIVADHGGKVIAECHKPLLNLFQAIPHIHQLTPYGGTPPAFDTHAPLLSLPHILGITLDTVPATIPYIPLPPTPAAILPPPLAATATFKVGLVWSGNPDNPYNRTRAIPLEQLIPLTQIPGIQLYSFQKEITVTDQVILEAHPEIIDLKAQLNDFVDTAALISQLDFILSVDTSVTHLAGALGKPVWLLLPFAPDWRWMLDRADSPWYPSLRIFRQPTYGDWEPVVAEIRAAFANQLQPPLATSTIAPAQLSPTKKSKSKSAKSPAKSTKAFGIAAQRPSAPLRPADVSVESPIAALSTAGKAQPPSATQPSATQPSATQPGPTLEQVLTQYHQNQLPEANRLCRQLLQHQPTHLEAMHLLGVILCQSQQLEAAIAQFHQVLDQQPNFVEALGNLGSALQQSGKLGEAIPYYERAIALKPDFADAHYNLSIALQSQYRYAEALPHSQRTLALKPNFAEAHYNQAYLLRRLGKVPEAIAHYQTAVQFKPDWAEAHKNLGHVLLLSGNLPDGFKEYEWRWQQPSWRQRPLPQPLWDGGSLRGKTILLYPEQGAGDTLQFIRYAPLLQQQGAIVLFECPESLYRVIETAPGIDCLFPEGTPLPAFDIHAPLMSLPLLLGTTLETIPATIPYLQPNAVPAAAPTPASTPTTAATGLKIGLVWAGNPGHKNDRDRSCPFSHFQPLLQLPHTTFYSLQKGTAAQAAQTSPASLLPLTAAPSLLHDLSPQLHDFADTAAAIADLDLVITVDTAVAHLAGALGKPVWVLLAFAPDWRWLLDRTDSPWYPTLRLFRQASPGDWEGVFAQVKTALQAQLAAQFGSDTPSPSRHGKLKAQLTAMEQQLALISTQILTLSGQIADIKSELLEES